MNAHDFAIPRYLVPFDLRRLPAYHADVLVIGSGVAGAMAALVAGEHADVVLVGKGTLTETNTNWARGGVAAVWSAEDSIDRHLEDTWRAAQGLGDREVIRRVVAGGRQHVERLIAWGAQFDRGLDQDYALSREGGHSMPRVLHAYGDQTGREVQRVLVERLRAAERIATFENVFVVDLITDPLGRCRGALAWSTGQGLHYLAARKTILASGGAGQIYRETTNPAIATGDGLALALRAGARLRDPEFVQFHPTLLYIAGASRVLISEIVRGAGAHLRDRNGHRFMPDYHPDSELAPRDVVSRAIFRQMVETRDTSVYLHLDAIEGDVYERFPGIAQVCRYFDIDIARDPVPVRPRGPGPPGPHSLIGGVEVALHGRTDCPDLYACGEVASSGLHGANRLGSNSLLEGLVLGALAGRDAVETLDGGVEAPPQLRVREHARSSNDVEFHLDDLTYSLKSLMWRNAGIERSEELLDEALGRLSFWGRFFFRGPLVPPRSIEVANMLQVAYAVALGAALREESRGVHYRQDHPDTAPEAEHVLLGTRAEPDEGEGEQRVVQGERRAASPARTA